MQRSRRIASAADFGLARQQGKAYRDARLVLLVRPNDAARTRFGFVTSKRLGKAVVRNRVRRLMREAARHTADSVAEGYDVVVIATRSAVASDYQEICESFRALTRKAGLLGDEG